MRKTLIVLSVVVFGAAAQCLATDLIDVSVDSITGPRVAPRDQGPFRAYVHNLGSYTLDTLWLRIRDGDDRAVRRVSGLDSGETREVSFNRPDAYQGEHVLSCSVEVVGDVNPVNDCDTHRYFVEPGRGVDIAVWFWPDTVDSGEVGHPSCLAVNPDTTDSLSFRLDYEIFSPSDERTYCESLYVERLAPGKDTLLVFEQEWRAFPPGWHSTFRSTYVAMSSYIGYLDRVYVRPSGAVAEGGVGAEVQRTRATVCRGELFLPQAGMANDQVPMIMLDVSGRKVVDLRLGINDIRQVAPGIYFVLSAVSGQRPAVTKVVIQR
jgi:hypothetical protein